MFQMLPDVWGSVLLKGKVDIGPKTLFGVELSSSGSEKTVPSVDAWAWARNVDLVVLGCCPMKRIMSSMKALRVSFGRLWGIVVGLVRVSIGHAVCANHPLVAGIACTLAHSIPWCVFAVCVVFNGNAIFVFEVIL